MVAREPHPVVEGVSRCGPLEDARDVDGGAHVKRPPRSLHTILDVGGELGDSVGLGHSVALTLTTGSSAGAQVGDGG